MYVCMYVCIHTWVHMGPGMPTKICCRFAAIFQFTAQLRWGAMAASSSDPKPTYPNYPEACPKRAKKGCICGFPKMGVPQNGWFIRIFPLKWMIWGVPPFMETSIFCCIVSHLSHEHFAISVAILWETCPVQMVDCIMCRKKEVAKRRPGYRMTCADCTDCQAFP